VLQQVADRDRVAVGQHAREHGRDRVVEADGALVDELEHDGGDERLGRAADAEAQVGPHRAPAAPRQVPCSSRTAPAT